MKTKLIIRKLPKLVDYGLAVAVNSVPGIAETDAETKKLYQSIAKQLFVDEIRSKHQLAKQKIAQFSKLYPRLKNKAA